jgi:heme/copper-type cytochrome/quinol oxidase subunit 2
MRRRLFLAAPLLLLAGTAGAQEEVAVRLSREGVKPGTIRLRKGEETRLLLTTSDEEHCFAVDDLRIEKRVVPGRTTVLDLAVERAGTFEVHCCLEPENERVRGRIVVTD